jgi:hypothetical protein
MTTKTSLTKGKSQGGFSVAASSSADLQKGSVYTQYEKTQKGSPKGKTIIVVRKDVGFNNNLFIRGQGANLSWDKGIKLTNVKANEWVYEIDEPFATCEFKVLLNDEQYETGKNHLLESGAIFEYIPYF